MLYNFTQFINESLHPDEPYVFLDLNGVMLPYKKNEEDDHHEFFDIDSKWSEKAIDVLNSICSEFKPNVVIISSYIREKKLEEIVDRLADVGVRCNVVDVLDNFHGKKNRFSNIDEYVDLHSIENYVVIDDHKHDLKEAPSIESHWCNTKSKKGLTKKHIEKIRSILNKKSHH
jgi:hypothetical protein